MVLAADVGGTKTAVGLFTPGERGPRRVRHAVYPSQEARSFESIARRFLSEGREKVHACAIGVAGPVVDGKSSVVNLPWVVDRRRVARGLGIDHVTVLNDLEATAWGIPQLRPKQMVSLAPSVKPRPGNAAVIAAGTGLGMAILFWDGRSHRPSAGEGGHQGFAPRDDREAALLRHAAERFGRVSVERIVSGPGLSVILRFLAAERGGVPARLAQRMAAGDPNAAISEAGLHGDDAMAEEALDLFVSLYGAAAGDLALVARATAGVYVAGGMARKILPKLRSGAFLEAFRAKGRLAPFVSGIPVRVILEPQTALIGAAVCALRTPSKSMRGHS